ncbi:MAG: flavin reductase [Treponema sp.]|jgi:flavin reductase (DIM6/NTAB) family NADH-FMN oxidoreductase RutF/rubredoxin|nr:flavin reductase [Treponema sp.]
MDNTALWKLSYGLYVVGVKKEEGRFGGSVVDAVAQVAAGDQPALVLSSMKNNLTNALIKSAGRFTLSILPANADPFVVANFGFQSARDADKWANVPYSLKDGLPVLDCAIAFVNCNVIESKELGTHTLFICEIVDAQNGETAAKPLLYADYQENMKAAAGEAFKKFKETGKPPAEKKAQWRCPMCGYVYDGETSFEELPDDWACPLCGVGKDVFEKVE